MYNVTITSIKPNYPAPLASWAEGGRYDEARWLEENWARKPNSGAHLFLGMLKEIEGTKADPARFLGDEGTYIAEYEGQIGFHQEFELEATFNYPQAPHDRDREVSIAEYDGIATALREKLVELAKKFPKTKFFVSSGEVTYKGCICINAFTPLEHVRTADGISFISPYLGVESLEKDCPTFKEISELMTSIVWDE